MKHLIILILASALPVMSQAANYQCTNSNSGAIIRIATLNSTIKVLSQNQDINEFGTSDLQFDPSYKPRPQHAGAHRYSGQNDCGEFQFIIDMQMVASQNGHATWAADCDSDGTGPTFENYQCELN